MSMQVNQISYGHFMDTLESLNKLSQQMVGGGAVPFADTSVAEILPRVFRTLSQFSGGGRNLPFASEIGDNLPMVIVRAPTPSEMQRATSMGIPQDMQGEGLWDMMKHAAHSVAHGARWMWDRVQHIPGVREAEKLSGLGSL